MDKQPIDVIVAAHLLAGGVLAFFKPDPSEAVTLILGVEVFERSRYAPAFPSLFRQTGPFSVDVAATLAGYFLIREMRK